MSKLSLPKARRLSRKLAFQTLFGLRFQSLDTMKLKAQFSESIEGLGAADINYYDALVHGVVENLANIDDHISQVVGRPIETLQAVELSLLRLSGYELIYRLDVPYKVVINEALELQKEFGADEGRRFVNGVLDRLALLVRNDIK